MADLFHVYLNAGHQLWTLPFKACLATHSSFIGPERTLYLAPSNFNPQ
jgi:hypothetical protein